MRWLIVYKQLLCTVFSESYSLIPLAHYRGHWNYWRWLILGYRIGLTASELLNVYTKALATVTLRISASSWIVMCTRRDKLCVIVYFVLVICIHLTVIQLPHLIAQYYSARCYTHPLWRQRYVMWHTRTIFVLDHAVSQRTHASTVHRGLRVWLDVFSLALHKAAAITVMITGIISSNSFKFIVPLHQTITVFQV
jgi:hypothetical protein